MVYLWTMVGGLLMVAIISRFGRLAFGRNALVTKRQYFRLYGVILGGATIVGGFGLADGGPPRFLEAFMTYLPPTLIVAAFDFYRDRARSRKAASA